MGSDNNENTDKNISELGELDVFLRDHYEKFAVMGIFGTVSLFIGSGRLISKSSLAARLGMISGVSVFALSAFLIAVAARKELIKIQRTKPSLAHFGYAIILVSTGTLSLSVLSITGIYSQASKIVFDLIAGVILIVIYFGYYPGELRVKDDVDKNAKLSFITFSSFLASAPFVNNILRPVVKRHLPTYIEPSGLDIVPGLLAVIPILFMLREGLIGFTNISIPRNFDLRSKLTASWAIRTNILFSTSVLILFTWYAQRVAQHAVGPNIGYYSVLGIHWDSYVFIHWIILSAIFSGYIFAQPTEIILDNTLQRASKYTTIAVFIACLTGVVYFLPRGVHVIPI